MENLDKVLNKFKVLLLDMNKTFMFGEDRFGTQENFFETYLALGGGELSQAEVNQAIRACYEGMALDYRNPAKFDDFSQIREGLCLYAGISEDRATELSLLEGVFAHHELGHIPPDYAAFLVKLSHSHELGLVSNIWSNKYLWLKEFQKAEISGVFKHTVFSSDYRSIKPSTVLYREALSGFDVDSSEILFIGDSLKYDMQGAREIGLSTMWINEQQFLSGQSHPLADYVIPNLLYLENIL
jgi:putative hydrolase of the HAD superfamily